MRDGSEVDRLTGEFPVQFVHGRFAARVDEKSPGEVQEVVSSGSCNGPRVWQTFAWLKNFFRDDPRIWRSLAQAAEVFGGIAKAIGMIHADAIQFAAAEPIQDQL